MIEQQYLDLLNACLLDGDIRKGRNGVTRSLFGRQMYFDLSVGFPLLTTKEVNFHAIVVELLWFLRGDTNIKFLHEHDVHIWDEWADEDGNLGRIYGAQWRRWGTGLDQISKVIEGLRSDPYGRRHIVTAWNPAEINQMALPPCHCLFQFYVDSLKRLSCQVYQRSADIFLGVPFNIASYALLIHIIAHEAGLLVGELIHTLGDVHLYNNHIDQAKEQLTRKPRRAPYLVANYQTDMFNLKPSNFELVDYDPHPPIKAEVSK